MRGRKPRATALKIAGGEQSSRINWQEPKPVTGIPARPDYLNADGLAKWDEMVSLLSGLGILTTADGDALGTFCEAHQTYRSALADIHARGIVIEGKSGPVKNPSVQVSEKCREHMLRVLGEFGLTPSSRSRVKTNNPAPDALTAFMQD